MRMSENTMILFAVSLVLLAVFGEKASSKLPCEVVFERVDCFQDNGIKPRPLTEMILSERNKIDWNNWGDFIEGFACRCAEKTMKEGYDTFGLQYYGECWSGPENLIDIDKDGLSQECVGPGYKTCTEADKFCMGKGGANFIYKIRQPTCSVSIERVGCYYDNQVNPRPLPLYILSERDKTVHAYNGTDIDWENWNSYMPEFICRCATLSKSKGYKIFSLQFYGECWSGPDAVLTYERDGESANCVSKNFRPCKPDDKYCVGKQHTNFVYRIVERCDVSYRQLGCYRDKLNDPRPLPRMLATERDTASSLYNGYLLDWRRWDYHIEGMVCRCAKRSFDNKYNIFGLQHYAECWSGDGTSTYRRDGKSHHCVTKQFQDCPPGGLHCAGEASSNYIYYITSCRVKVEPIGCYHDDLINPRPLPDLILSERDSTSALFNGVRINWRDWDNYVPEFICRCAEKAKELNRDVIGLQFFGECWSGKDGLSTYNRNGNSTKCIGPGFKPCPAGSKECLGMASTNYVYRIV